MAVGDVYQVRWEFNETALGRKYTPGFQVRQVDPTFDAAGVAAAAVELWAGTIGANTTRSFYATELQLDAILIRRVKPLEDLEQRITTSLPLAGTSTADRLAPENAVLISHRTTRIGRSRRGRTYFPAPTETVNDEPGSWTTTFTQHMFDAWEAMQATLSGILTGQPQTVFSETLNSDELVTVSYVDRRVRSQRKRNVQSPLYVTS